MKKWFALLLCLLLPLCASAEETKDGDFIVTLEGVSFTFTPPGGICLTRESSASVFGRAGLSQREVVPFMEEYDLYAILLDEAMTFEVQLTAYPTDDADYDTMDEAAGETVVAAFRSVYEDMGCQVQSAGIYQGEDGHKFVLTCYLYQYEGVTEYVAEYLTCQKGYAVVFTLLPYWGAATDDQITYASALADSLHIQAN